MTAIVVILDFCSNVKLMSCTCHHYLYSKVNVKSSFLFGWCANTFFFSFFVIVMLCGVHGFWCSFVNKRKHYKKIVVKTQFLTKAKKATVTQHHIMLPQCVFRWEKFCFKELFHVCYLGKKMQPTLFSLLTVACSFWICLVKRTDKR